MSVRLMTKVWDSGAYTGGTLLTLLALADWANDQGERVFPRLEAVADKARLSVKQARRVLESLIEDGIVIDVDKTGVKKGTRMEFRLDLSKLPPRDILSQDVQGGGDGGSPVRGAGHSEQATGTFAPANGTSAVAYIDKPSTEPSREPSREPPLPVVAGEVLPDVDLAILAYNEAAEIYPKWTVCERPTAGRKKIISARLDEVGLDGWRRAVDLAAASAFLGGPVPKLGEHRNWRMTIDWFAKADKFAKIYEGGFPPGSGPGGSGGGGGLESAFAGVNDFLNEERG